MPTPSLAVVTGGGAGIGAAITRRLADDGYHVLAVDRDAKPLESLVAQLRNAGRNATALVADVASPTGRRTILDTIRDLGEPDVLVNNAAVTGPRVPFLSLHPDQWTRIIDTNLTAAAFLAQGVAASMIARRDGCIVNVGAIQEAMPLPTYVAYAASKGGVSALTRALAVELSPFGIRVNSVEPGSIATATALDAATAARRTAGTEHAAAAPALLGRFGDPPDVAGAVAFLASSDASFITGAVIRVDGGRSLSRAPDDMSALSNVVAVSSAGKQDLS